MSVRLGRALMKHETVHHKNGIRHDNRLENLELWTTSQTPCQRVEDVVAFIAKYYAKEVVDAIKKINHSNPLLASKK